MTCRNGCCPSDPCKCVVRKRLFWAAFGCGCASHLPCILMLLSVAGATVAPWMRTASMISALLSVIALIIGKGWRKRALAFASLCLVGVLLYAHPAAMHADVGHSHHSQPQGAPAEHKHNTDPADPLCDPTGKYSSK